MTSLIAFAYLQVLDMLSTLAFLAGGVGEANPIVRLALSIAPSPFEALLAVKVLAMTLAVYCWISGRHRVLECANVFFAVLVVWNLAVLVAKSIQA